MTTNSKLPSYSSISRRGFLKLSGAGVAGLLLPPGKVNAMHPDQQGRVLEETVSLFDIPSFTGKMRKIFWRDAVIPIHSVTVGDDSPEHNRIWYRIEGEGFVHSSSIQPVRTVINTPQAPIRKEGMLGEITVPYTDAHWGPGKAHDFAYRFYYATTCWVLGVTVDAYNQPWYRVFEDKWEMIVYAPAHHIRLVADDELALASPGVPLSEKRLEVRTEEQVLVAYERERPVFMARTSTGARFTNGDFSTQHGRYMIFHKRPSRHMAAGNLAANGYDLPGVPWVSYFTESGVSIHGTFWHNDFGRRRSHGCINLTPAAAKWVYLWCGPYVPPYEQRVWEEPGTILDVV